MSFHSIQSKLTAKKCHVCQRPIDSTLLPASVLSLTLVMFPSEWILTSVDPRFTPECLTSGSGNTLWSTACSVLAEALLLTRVLCTEGEGKKEVCCGMANKWTIALGKLWRSHSPERSKKGEVWPRL